MAYRRGKRNLSRQRSDSEDDDERYEPKADDYTEHMAEKYLRDEYLRQSITKYSDHPAKKEDFTAVKKSRLIFELAQSAPFYQVRQPRIPRPQLSVPLCGSKRKHGLDELCRRLNPEGPIAPEVVLEAAGIVEKRTVEEGERNASTADLFSAIDGGMRRTRTETDSSSFHEVAGDDGATAAELENEDFEAGDYGNDYNRESEEESGDDSSQLLL